MTRREALRRCAAWTRDWPDLPALALGSALAGWQLFVTLARVAGETIAREEREGMASDERVLVD